MLTVVHRYVDEAQDNLLIDAVGESISTCNANCGLFGMSSVANVVP